MAEDEMRKNGGGEGFPGGFCLVSRDEEERLLFVDEGAVRLLGFSSKEELLMSSDGRFRGLSAEEGYMPLSVVYGKGPKGLPRYFRFSAFAVPGWEFSVNALLLPEDHEVYGKVWTLCLLPGKNETSTVSAPGNDPVTGFVEPHEFYRRSSEMAKRDRENHRFGYYACVHINIKNFKLYNTNHGSEAGDRLLRRMGEILRSSFPGCQMTRHSGDHFDLLVPAENLENRLQEIWESLSLAAGDPSISMKAGIVLFQKDDREKEALSCAMRTGSGQFMTSPWKRN